MPDEVGPAPLRRLSNHEYTFALQDLFPDVHPELPTLPRDGEVGGFDNAAEGQTPSDVRISRYETIANAYARAATIDSAAVRALLGCDYSEASTQETCAETFIRTTGRRVFRRPLTDDERDRFVLRFSRWQRSLDFEGAVQLTLSAFLQAPQFLYRPELLSDEDEDARGALAAVDPYALASRLSFFLWASVPDEELLAAAAADALWRTAELTAQAERMLADPRAERVLWDFHRQWLGLDRVLEEEHGVRTVEVDASWTPKRQLAAHEESRRFVVKVLGEGGSLKDLLLSRRAWVDAEVSELYGVPAPDDTNDDGFRELELPASERAGILTRAAFLAAYSHRGATSPPIRANAIRQRLLCRPPAPPPPELDTTPPTPDAASGPQTNRMLFETRTAQPVCRSCHVGLNGIGFGLENFTAAGKFTRVDHGLPVDSSGHLYGTDVDRDYVGGVQLSAALSVSEDLQHCAAQQWLRYALGRAPVEGEAPLLERLTTGLLAGSVKQLLLGVVTSASFRFQHTGED